MIEWFGRLQVHQPDRTACMHEWSPVMRIGIYMRMCRRCYVTQEVRV